MFEEIMVGNFIEIIIWNIVYILKYKYIFRFVNKNIKSINID